ncbi:MAG: hypothetical protein ABIP93_04435, partial [Gemmatimonadaceae bacterium]
IVAKVLSAQPERPTLVRKTIPHNVEAAVLTALAKLPADRFATAAEFGAALDNAGYDAAVSTVSHGAPASRTDRRLLAITSLVALLAIGVGAWGWLRPVRSASVLRYTISLPALLTGVAAEDPVPLPSADGSVIVFAGPRQGRNAGSRLWLKRRESRAATPIVGTDDAESFTLSPDGAWIAYVLGTRLVRVPVTGGAPVTIVPAGATGAFGLAWLDDGTIVYTRTTHGLSIAKVPASGGTATGLWESDSGRSAVLAPIGGSHALLFYRCESALFACDVWAGDLESGKHNTVLPGVTWARYAETGHLVYAQEGRLMAIAFDAGTFKVSGQPVALADSITRGDLPFELTRSGTLVTREQGGVGGDAFDMVWVDRSGRATPVDTTWKFDVTRYSADHGWALSPDGSRLAIGLSTQAGDDIWVKQLPHGPLSRISFNAAPEMRPRWTRDGRFVTFLSGRAGQGVFAHRADGLGTDSLLTGGLIDEGVLSPDGAWLVLRSGSNGSVAGGRDISAVRTGPDTTRMPLIVTPFDEEAIALSPDGRWIAYQSDETGRTEIFVRSFPDASTFKHQVSSGGGAAPLWSRDGRELFFVSAATDMMSARVTAGSPVSIAAPVPLFHIAEDLLRVEYAFYTPWDVAADGRFIMARARRTEAGSAKTMIVAENWLTELKARVKR